MNELKKHVVDIQNEAFALVAKAKTETDLNEIEIRFLGRKSEFNALLKGLKDLSSEERQAVGPLVNAIKQEMIRSFAEARQKMKLASVDWEKDRLDVTAPGVKLPEGHLHILTQVQREIEDIFTSMGFDIASGPEIETEFYNFDALNTPAHHPARDMQDTFYIKSKDGQENLSLRSQTSAVQVRYMEQHTPPFRIIAPGRVFRNEATDTTHEHTFFQFEALMVGEDINVGNLKYVAQEFFSRFFKTEVKIRLRPSYFPFVEPGFEFDISCLSCGGEKGCSACRHNGWLELGGAGMVNQNVFVNAGYERNRYQGLAWGFGLERLAMMKYDIPDIRLFHSGDTRFLSQF
ncbi:MAG: phenylalanine--tRNA ligase subunit alpha [Candidatus Moranbacteria bacterium]|nr:phenylalanine--tRNA ligase subunit alpha [Candidatus Moranbacteria bacterium]